MSDDNHSRDNRLAAETAIARDLLQRNVELGTRADNAEAACDDLREQLAAANERAEKAEARVAHLDKARDAAVREWKPEHDAADTLQAENAKLRAQLDGLGEEWRFDDGMGKFTVSRLKLSPADIRHLEQTTGCKVEHRLVGKWQDATEADAADAAADGHSATQTDAQ